jgi:hypothetical protein
MVNKRCLRIKIVASKTRAGYASSKPTVIRTAILTRNVAVQGQSGFRFTGRFSTPQGVLSPPSDRPRADLAVLSEAPGTGVGVCAIAHG